MKVLGSVSSTGSEATLPAKIPKVKHHNTSTLVHQCCMLDYITLNNNIFSICEYKYISLFGTKEKVQVETNIEDMQEQNVTSAMAFDYFLFKEKKIHTLSSKIIS